MEPFRYFAGSIPLIVSVPHCGTFVPEGILARLTPAAKQLPDTDWHVDRLYAFAREMGVHMIAATHSRYVVDLNRGADNASLYPGQFTTGLCPTTLFDGAPLYTGAAPGAAEVAERTELYWKPYHARLSSLIAELKATHGKVILFDAHSIASQVPLLFEGTLPDLNFGTADGVTADAGLMVRVMNACAGSRYSVVHNGRFKGGYITRNYGRPAEGVQTIQLELAQKNYMQEQAPFAYDEAKALELQEVLCRVLSCVATEFSS